MQQSMENLSAPEELMIGLLERSRDCIKILGMDGTLDFMNCGGCDALEIEEFSAVRGQLWWSLWPAHTQATVRSMFECARNGQEAEFSADCPTMLGNMRSWAVKLKPMRTQQGDVVGVLCTSRDITG